ncbi:type II toxin-antitoxin system HicB family antitoxin [Patescibacteria group bacterium]|nr:type II toxin-antitoxin system HicB family antitoxin [Patescibacteria group bacterium]MCG2694947.1 type II toxin-antitoxin system HicB family antitoxin [Candidatus Parcubacteria bacterium]
MRRTTKTKNQTFPIILNKEKKGGYFVINPAFEGCYSQGETIEEALENIKEATELCMEDNKKSISEFSGIHTINIQYA